MSDRLGRVPKGTLVRPAADWFGDNCYSGGAILSYIPPNFNDNYIMVGLFNNDDQGRVARIYGFSGSDNGFGGFGFYFIQGTTGSLQAGAVQATRPDRSPPNLQIYWARSGQNAFFSNPFALGPQFGHIGCNGGDGVAVFPGSALFVIPVGYMLIATNIAPTSADQVGAWFYFQMAAN